MDKLINNLMMLTCVTLHSLNMHFCSVLTISPAVSQVTTTKTSKKETAAPDATKDQVNRWSKLIYKDKDKDKISLLTFSSLVVHVVE